MTFLNVAFSFLSCKIQTIGYKNLCQDHYRRLETTNNPLKPPPTNQYWELHFENWCNIYWKREGRGGGAEGQQN